MEKIGNLSIFWQHCRGIRNLQVGRYRARARCGAPDAGVVLRALMRHRRVARVDSCADARSTRGNWSSKVTYLNQ